MSTQPIYPPSTTDPAATATPQRTTILNTRGSIVPAVEFVQATLQAIFPRRIFPSSGGAVDQQRLPTLCPVGWRRGGTSPAGASLGGTPGGNYFLGDSEKFLNESAPQRIIWIPPGVGEETWGPPQQLGPFKDPSVEQLPELMTPQSPVSGEHFRQMGNFSSAQFATRVIPMEVRLWGSDYSDTEELVHWFGSAVQLCFNGNLSVAGQDLLGPGGWTEDWKGTRGLHYVLTVRLTAPVHYPYWVEAVAHEVALRLSGQAPMTVVEGE